MPHDSGPSTSLRTGFQLGPWLLTHKIAAGGMGEVFVALRAGKGADQKPVAVKVLRAHLSPDADSVERFLTEARIAMRFAHKHLVRVVDVGEDEGRRWLAMDLFEGVSLDTLLSAAKKAGQSLSPEVLCWIGYSLCEGLGHAHGLEVVHRDVTPHNVLVGVDGEVRLADFGVAQVRAGDTSSRPGMMMGKLQYLSPEQLEGLPSDGRSDLYSAGVTLFVLATLEEPFVRSTPHEVARAIRSEAPPDLAAKRPDLPPELVKVVRRAMEKKPDDRFKLGAQMGVPLKHLGHAGRTPLGELVRSLCAAQVASLSQAIAEARELAPQTAVLVPPRPSAPSFPPSAPRGTLEVETVSTVRRRRRRQSWGWIAAGAAALALLGLLVARLM
jgi:eukaryotic-like serine/threonine-protein kinase